MKTDSTLPCNEHYTQDKCTFNTHDGTHYIWVHPEHQPLRNKGHGKGLHVSDLLTPIGRLGRGKVCVTLACGGDIWQTGERLLKQGTTKAIPALEAQFPGCQALFAFDYSRNHLQYGDDALRISEMNLEPDGINQKVMRDTWVTDLPEPKGGYMQSMKLPSGIPKGLKLVLIERGLWPYNQLNFLTQCSIPASNGKKPKLNPASLEGGTCCAWALLAVQPDFLDQKPELQATIEEACHLVILYPPCDCEINFIEYFWGAAKHYTRKHCNYHFESLQLLVPEALASIPNTLISKYHARTIRIMDAIIAMWYMPYPNTKILSTESTSLIFVFQLGLLIWSNLLINAFTVLSLYIVPNIIIYRILLGRLLN